LKLAAFFKFHINSLPAACTGNEQNLAQCIGRPHGADFFSLFLIPDPLSMCKYLHKIRTMHSTQWIRDQLLSCAGDPPPIYMEGHCQWSHRDLYYSGLYSAVTTLIPD